MPHSATAPITEIDDNYYVISTWPTGSRAFAAPGGAATDSSGNVYIADTRNHMIKKLSSAGVVLDVWGSKGSGPGEFNEPHDVVVGASTGNIYVADTGNSRVQVLASDGSFVRSIGGLAASAVITA